MLLLLNANIAGFYIPKDDGRPNMKAKIYVCKLPCENVI